MKVALISFHTFSQPGGVKRHILGLHQEFKKRGIQSKIIVPRRKKSEDYGKEVILLGTSFPLNVSGTQSEFNINFNPIAIGRVLRKEKFDVLHFHNFFGTPSALQILSSPVVSPTLNILTFHANIEGSKFLKSFPSIIYLLNKICQWKIDGVIGVAPLNLKIFKNYDGPKIVIPNGIDLNEFNPKIPKIKKFSDPEKSRKVNILFVGRIEERKGLIYLLKAYEVLEKTPAFKQKGGVRLIIVGEGGLKQESERWVKERNLREVYFEGEKIDKELPPYFTGSDIFVSPAIFGESFGIVLLEAMACGLPIVAFANSGYKEFFKGKKGEKFLAKPKNFRELAQKLEILIKNPGLRKEMGEWGIKEAKKYSWPEIADRVLNFYDFCQKEKLKRQKEKRFLLEETFDKIIDKIENNDFLNWFKKLK